MPGMAVSPHCAPSPAMITWSVYSLELAEVTRRLEKVGEAPKYVGK